MIRVRDNYAELVEETFVEPGHDVAPEKRKPDAWQFRTRKLDGKWTFWLGPHKPDMNPSVFEIRPLYAGKPE